MSYDDTSFTGDLIVDEYDEQNNFMNPESSMGFLVYHLLGDGFDIMSEAETQFMNDTDILSADSRGLDMFWGLSYNMPRPNINGRLLTDDEYKIYLYLRNCQLLTRQDIETCFNKCFGVDDYGIYFSTDTNYLHTVDHLDYESEDTINSNLARNNEDDSDEYIIDYTNPLEDVKGLEGFQSTEEDEIIIINVPYNGYDEDFLELLIPYISIKGNVLIKEYNL